MFHRFVALACLALSAPVSAASLDDAINLMPANSSAAVFIPSLKVANDHATELVQGMDRPELLTLIGRPLDLLKGQAGIASGLNDHGAAVVAFMQRGEEMVPVALVPVSDAKAFLDGNFDAKDPVGDPDAWLTTDGRTVYARAIGEHVAISPDAAALRDVAPAPGAAASLRARLGPRGEAMLARGEVVFWASGDAAIQGVQRQNERAIAMSPAEVPASAVDVTKLQGLKDVVGVVDFDPLGLVMRSWAHAEPESECGRLMAGGQGRDRSVSLSRIPSGPYYFMAAIDLIGLGGGDLIQMLAPDVLKPPPWLLQAQGIQLGVYPSKLGVAVGGVMNDAAMVVETAEPQAALEAFRARVRAMGGESATLKADVTWEDSRTLKSGTTTGAYEVKETVKAATGGNAGLSMGIQQMIKRIIFGQRGFHGFVKTIDNALVLTFSQRPDVLERALGAAQGGERAADPVIESMRAYLIPDADIEVFIGVGQWGKLLSQVAGMVPGGGAQAFEIDPGVDPVGFAMEIDENAGESALLIPASVLAVMYDQAIRQANAQAAPPPAEPAEAQP